MKRLLLAAALLLIGPLLGVAASPDAGSFKGTAALELWSLREQFKSDGVPATLDKAKAFGFTVVETAGTQGLSAEAFLKELRAHGLNPVSGHFQYEALTKDLAGAIREAKTLGLKYMCVPWIPHDEKAGFTEADARHAAADFNKWGEALQKEGITFAYHPHGYEFRPRPDGSTLFDLLVAETKPEFVAYQMDVFWITHPGVDPVALLQKYPSRWKLMHLKDLKKGVPTGVYTGDTPDENDVPIGTGQVNWPAVLSAAAKVGIAYYFIEDESPTVLQSIPKSLAYLESLKIAH